MSNDPFFDAWVRNRLKEAEARAPEHLWDAIRKRNTFYILRERTKYAFFVALLLLATWAIGYWGFHGDAANRPTALADSHGPRQAGEKPPATPTSPKSATRAMAPMETASIQGTGMSPAPVSVADAGVTGSPVAPDLYGDESASGDLPPDFVPGESLAVGVSAAQAGIPARASLTPPLVSRRRNPVLLEWYVSPDHPAQYMTASSPAYVGYVNENRHVITAYPSYSAGFRINVPIAGNWSLRTGINFSQINERFNYTDDNVKQVVTDLTNRQVTTATGATVTIRDTSRVVIDGKLIKRSLNAYRMVDLPLLVSYSLPRMGSLQISGSTGALINLASWYTGDILDTAGAPVALNTKPRGGVNAWKKSIGTAWYGSMILRSRVSPRLQATLEPYLRYDLSTVNQDVSVFRQRYVTTGLMAGLAYRLGR